MSVAHTRLMTQKHHLRSSPISQTIKDSQACRLLQLKSLEVVLVSVASRHLLCLGISVMIAQTV
jgi:hypothetical protein